LRGGAQQAQQSQVVRVASQDVLVAAKTLPAGTVIKGDDVRFQKWPEDALDPTYQVREKGADPQKVAIGFIVLHGIEAGQPITPQRLLKPGEGGFLAAVLVPGMHAVTVKIDAVSAAAGFILPQDRVDVVLNEHYSVTQGSGTQLASQNLAKFDNKEVSSIILRDVRVLAVDQGMADINSQPKLGATATLEVDLLQAQKVEVAAQLGSLSLILRSHTLPTAERPEPSGPIVEDYEVSPFRAALLRQVYANLAAAQVQTQQANGDTRGGELRVYRGAQAAAPGAQQ
jgi:pilus assembly protein CpaB